MPPKRPFRLYSYVLRFDDGAAPNPFNGVCTLVICKPRIRLGANEGDWIAGTGSANSPLGDKRGWLIYAMKLTRPKMTLRAYDQWANQDCPGKLPDPSSSRIERRCGDAIYDYSGDKVQQRWSVHGPGNRATDLSGDYALLSEHFYYFGREPIELPAHLKGICHPNAGERWRPNEELKHGFVNWLESLRKPRNQILAPPASPPLRRSGPSAQSSCGSSCATSAPGENRHTWGKARC